MNIQVWSLKAWLPSGSIVNLVHTHRWSNKPLTVLIGFASGFTQDANINEIEISNIVFRKSSDMNLVYPGGTIHVPSLNFEKSSIKIKVQFQTHGKKF